MIESESIAITVALGGYVPLGVAIGFLYRDGITARANEKSALLQGIEMEQSRTAELTSISEVVSSMQRAIVGMDGRLIEQDSVHKGLVATIDELHLSVKTGVRLHAQHHQAIFSAIKKTPQNVAQLDD